MPEKSDFTSYFDNLENVPGDNTFYKVAQEKKQQYQIDSEEFNKRTAGEYSLDDFKQLNDTEKAQVLFGTHREIYYDGNNKEQFIKYFDEYNTYNNNEDRFASCKLNSEKEITLKQFLHYDDKSKLHVLLNNNIEISNFAKYFDNKELPRIASQLNFNLVTKQDSSLKDFWSLSDSQKANMLQQAKFETDVPLYVETFFTDKGFLRTSQHPIAENYRATPEGKDSILEYYSGLNIDEFQHLSDLITESQAPTNVDNPNLEENRNNTNSTKNTNNIEVDGTDEPDND